MVEYVLGFLFSDDLNSVVLIEKRKPAFQAGKLNGVGGKLEVGETINEAMVREFKEETGVEHIDWERFCVLRDDDSSFIVHCFASASEDAFNVETAETEQVCLLDVKHLDQHSCMRNLVYLIPMALHSIEGRGLWATITYE